MDNVDIPDFTDWSTRHLKFLFEEYMLALKTLKNRDERRLFGAWVKAIDAELDRRGL